MKLKIKNTGWRSLAGFVVLTVSATLGVFVFGAIGYYSSQLLDSLIKKIGWIGSFYLKTNPSWLEQIAGGWSLLTLLVLILALFIAILSMTFLAIYRASRKTGDYLFNGRYFQQG